MPNLKSTNNFIDSAVLGLIAYLPPNPASLMNKIGSTHPRFVCFLYEDNEETRRDRNSFLAKFTQDNLESYIETVPLPPDPAESFEWLFDKVNWEVDYFLQSLPGSNTSNILFVVSGVHVPVVVALYTVALQRNTKFMYFNDETEKLERPRNTNLSILPSLFKSRGEPYRSAATRKYSEGYYGTAAYDFALAWQESGDKSLHALSLLSACYDYLDKLAYSLSKAQLERLMQDENCMTRLADVAGSTAYEQVQRLHRFLQIACLHFGSRNKNEIDVMKDSSAINVFIRSLFASAMRRIEHHEFEQAVLLLYRALEAVAQHLLAKNDIDPSNFDISVIGESARRKLISNLSKLFGQNQDEIEGSLSRKRIGALDCWAVYLFCFFNGEPSFLQEEDSRLKYLGKIRNLIELRNRCFLEHGIDGVNHEDAIEFAGFVQSKVVKPFMNLEITKAEEDADIAPLNISTVA